MNYGELKTHFQSILNRRDLTTTLRDTFLEMSIARIQRELRAPLMEKSINVTISDTYDGLDIPSDYLALVSITVVSEESKLQRVDLEVAQMLAENTAIPQVFSRQGGKWVLGPTPAENTVIRIDYFAEFGALTLDADENTLTLVAPDLITYGALVYAAEYFLDRRMEAFEARYQEMLNGIQAQADFDELSQAVMRPCFTMADTNF